MMIPEAKGHKIKIPCSRCEPPPSQLLAKEVLISLPNYTGDRYFH